MVCVIMRSNYGNLSAIVAKMVDEHESRATHTVDGAEGFGAEQDSLALEGGWKQGKVSHIGKTTEVANKMIGL